MSEQTTALVPVDARKNLPAESRNLIATVRNDITIPFFNAVLQPLDDTLIQRGGGLGLKLYDEIERDTHAFSVLSKRKNELTARDWEIEPATKEPIDAEVATFISDVCMSLPFDQICHDLLDANLKGFSVGEVVWARNGNAIVPDSIVTHDQRRFAFDGDWRLRLLTREAMREGILLPDRKFIVHRVGVKGNNPYGLGLGSRLFWAVLFKREGIAFWMTFLEKFASPTPVGKIPVGTPPEVQAAVLRALEGFAQSRGITVPIGTELELLEATRPGSASYEAWARYWDEQMSVCVLGETLSTVMGSVGSLAAAEVHSEGKSQLIDADADLLSDTLQRTLFRWLIDYNFPGRPVPRLKRLRRKNQKAEGEAREQTAKAEVAEVAALNRALDLASGLDRKIALPMVRRISSLAAKMEDAELVALLVKPRPRTPADPVSPKKPGMAKEDEEPEPAFAAPADVLGKAHPPDGVYDAFAVALEAPIGVWMTRVRAALNAADTLETFADRLLHLAVELPIDSLAERLADALTFAALLGRASVVIEAEADGVTTAELFADAGADPGIVFEGAPMTEAMEFLRQKVALPQKGWRDLTREGHDRAFVVAGVTRQDVAADLQAMVVRNLEKGGIEGFRAEFGKLLASGKWTGDAELIGDAKKRAWRTRTIFMTNLRGAHAAGRLKQQQGLKAVLPFWQYRWGATRTPKRGREPHIRMDGLTLPADDAAWSKIYPPNGWLCSCAVRAITAAAAGRAPIEKRDVPMQHDIDLAVDPEWQSAPGNSWERGLVPKADAGVLDGSIARATQAVSQNLPPLSSLAKPLPKLAWPPTDATDEDLVARFLERFGATLTQAALFRDRAGQLVPASRALFETAKGTVKVKKRGRQDAIDQLAETLLDPDEIWVDWEQPRPGAPFAQPRLARTYLRYDPDNALLTGFVWTEDGWAGATAHTRTTKRGGEPDFAALEKRRHGALLYRREKK